MASFCILDEFEVHKNEDFLRIAEELKPELHETEIAPVRLLELREDGKPEPEVVSEEAPESLKDKRLKKDDKVILDFGNHHVGYVTLDLSSAGSHQDAPAYIYLKFAERLDELTADIASYNSCQNRTAQALCIPVSGNQSAGCFPEILSGGERSHRKSGVCRPG